MENLPEVWNFDSFIDTNKLDEYIEEAKKETRKFISKWKDRTDYLNDEKVLKIALDEYEKWAGNYGTESKAAYYLWLKSAQNQLDTEILAKLNKLEEKSTKLSNEIMFFTHNLSKIDVNTQKKFLNSELLKDYEHFLERIFNHSKYLLSDKEEKTINLLSKTSFSNWADLTETFLSEKEVPLKNKNIDGNKTFPELLSLQNHGDESIRKVASSKVNEILDELSKTAEIEMNSLMEYKRNMDELRGYNYPEQARILSDDLDLEVVEALEKAVTKHNYISQDFYKLKAKLLKKESFEYSQRSIPFGNIDKKYDYKKSVELVSDVFKNLDEEFHSIFQEFIKNGHIDVFPRKGKSGGAFCAHNMISEPTYILLNHTDTLRDVTTLAHESGHGINNEFMKKKQNSINFGTPLSTAEVASTFMEDFVLEKLLEDSDKETKLSILIMRLGDDIATIFRQIACFRFEKELHRTAKEKGYLSKEEIGELFRKHMLEYLGPKFESAKDINNGWVYWSHIRRFFYNYSYASGLLISKALQRNVRADKNYINKVKIFLANGLEKSPKNIFNEIGIDITDETFWTSGLKEIEENLKEAEILAKELELI